MPKKLLPYPDDENIISLTSDQRLFKYIPGYDESLDYLSYSERQKKLRNKNKKHKINYSLSKPLVKYPRSIIESKPIKKLNIFPVNTTTKLIDVVDTPLEYIPDFNKYTVVQLKDYMRQHKIKPLGGRKAELIDRIKQFQNFGIDSNIISENDIKSSYDNSIYKRMKVTELKKLLREKKLPVSGKKAELIARLEQSSVVVTEEPSIRNLLPDTIEEGSEESKIETGLLNRPIDRLRKLLGKIKYVGKIPRAKKDIVKVLMKEYRADIKRVKPLIVHHLEESIPSSIVDKKITISRKKPVIVYPLEESIPSSVVDKKITISRKKPVIVYPLEESIPSSVVDKKITISRKVQSPKVQSPVQPPKVQIRKKPKYQPPERYSDQEDSYVGYETYGDYGKSTVQGPSTTYLIFETIEEYVKQLHKFDRADSILPDLKNVIKSQIEDLKKGKATDRLLSYLDDEMLKASKQLYDIEYDDSASEEEIDTVASRFERIDEMCDVIARCHFSLDTDRYIQFLGDVLLVLSGSDSGLSIGKNFLIKYKFTTKQKLDEISSGVESLPGLIKEWNRMIEDQKRKIKEQIDKSKRDAARQQEEALSRMFVFPKRK